MSFTEIACFNTHNALSVNMNTFWPYCNFCCLYACLCMLIVCVCFFILYLSFVYAAIEINFLMNKVD